MGSELTVSNPRFGRNAFKQTGCSKEQTKQYRNYINEATKNNSELRQKL